jgi:hypothetical protein
LSRGLREEERDPSYVAANPGRRKGRTAGHVDPREEERDQHQCWGSKTPNEDAVTSGRRRDVTAAYEDPGRRRGPCISWGARPKNSATVPGRRRGTVAVDEDLREEERGLTSVRAFWP